MVVAVVQLQAGAQALTLQDVAALCRTHLEAYKIPKRVWVCDGWPQTASGKTDHVALAQALQASAPNPNVKGQPCLHPLL
jgi:long-chain acyl-CoA synthetase